MCIVAALATAPYVGGGTLRDDTAWLQARLDAGGSIFLPRLPNGECYATRGLWLSRDDTSISSDGACIVALGRGAARIKTDTGRPVRATAVFFLDHSNIFEPPPVRVTISGLRITVPAAQRMAGVAVFGHETTLSGLTIDGAPTANVVVGSGGKTWSGANARVAILDCTLSGGTRDVISAFGPIGLRVEGNTLAGAARGGAATYAGAGVHVHALDRGQATLDVRVVRNRIVDNGGPGVFFELDPANGPPVVASGVEISGNEILRNARRAPVSRRGGIVVAGGQRDGKGELVLTDNVVRGNAGSGFLGRKLRLQVRASGNDLSGNRGGRAKGMSAVAAPPVTAAQRWVPEVRAVSGQRDDTPWLQARLDAHGGTIFLPTLPNGECYATRGLWVSRDDTTITSDGACVVSLGPGDVRLRSFDGDPIASTAVFYVNRSRPTEPAPLGVTISNLRIVVPDGQGMYGVTVYGHDVTLSRLEIVGAPVDDVLIGGRANGNGYAARVAVLDSTLTGAARNAISAFGVIGLRIEGNTVHGVRDSPPGQPAAGIDIEPDDRGQPTLGLRIVRNTFRDNAGPGILLALDSNSGPAVLASDLEVSGNTIVRNSQKGSPPSRAGIVLSGGQDGGGGTLVLKDNVIRDNGGPGILAMALKLVVQASGNDLGGNEGGPTSGFTLAG